MCFVESFESSVPASACWQVDDPIAVAHQTKVVVHTLLLEFSFKIGGIEIQVAKFSSITVLRFLQSN
jgi:hypothetical protein